MIAPAVILALNLVQAPVACDWTNRPDGKMYVCASPENRSAIIAFTCDGSARTIKQIFFTIITGKPGMSGKMSVKNGSTEVTIPMLGVRVGVNGFVTPQVPEALSAVTKLLGAASGPLSFQPLDMPEVAAVSIDGAVIANALKTATAACKGP